ncbi:MAG TPA: hypothetical protein VFK80_08570, partial [Limnochordia bacterium]|nr:hypothetical protein [Limnochordia bacterium]
MAQPQVEPGAVLSRAELRQVRRQLRRNALSTNWRTFVAGKIGPIGLCIILFFLLFALAHPILMATVWDAQTYDPVMGFDGMQINPAPPSLHHLLGTDPIGRDILSQLMYSTWEEFVLGVVAAV